MFYLKNPRLGIWLVLALALGLVIAVRSGRSLEPSRTEQKRNFSRNLFSSEVYGFLKKAKRNRAHVDSVPNSTIYVTPKATSAHTRFSSSQQQLAYSSSVRPKRGVAVVNVRDAIPAKPWSLSVMVPGASQDNVESLTGPVNRRGKSNTQWLNRFSRMSVSAKTESVATDPPKSARVDTTTVPERNPFLAAIRDKFESQQSSVVASETARQERPQQEEKETFVAKSTPPLAPAGETREEVKQTAPMQREASTPNRNSASYVVVGDFGSRKLEMVGVTKSNSYSFTLDGNRGSLNFDSGLDFGPFQSFWLGKAGSQPFPSIVVADWYWNAVDWYLGQDQGAFVFQSGFYFPGGIPAGAAASDVNSDGALDLIVASPPRGTDLVDQGLLDLYLQKNGSFVYQRRIAVGFSIGAIHVTRSGGQTRVLAVDQTLSNGEVLTLDATGLVLTRFSNVPFIHRQDAKLTFSNGKVVGIRLAEFGDAAFLGSFEDGEFHLIAAVENAGPLPFMAVGDLKQDGQRRCWLHF
ncbi:MAG: VCBS repeat-containing protein [Acidobacteria bacterium]|nr:VCBS repeat-containing protein [Acidobacteriota bacterium]